jgi:hypothetical protein
MDMKRVTARILIGLCTFTIGVVAAIVWLKYRAPVPSMSPVAISEIEIPQPKAQDDTAIHSVSFCDLIHDPHRYDRKFIRMQASLEIAPDGATFYDPMCVKENIWVRPTFFLIGSDEKVEVFWRKLERLAAWQGKLEVMGQFHVGTDQFSNSLDLLDAKQSKSTVGGRK